MIINTLTLSIGGYFRGKAGKSIPDSGFLFHGAKDFVSDGDVKNGISLIEQQKMQNKTKCMIMVHLRANINNPLK